MVIGERLRAVRLAKGLSQGDVEEKTGLLRCYLSRCEQQHTIPSIATLEKWSAALGVSMSELFSDTGKAAKPLAAFKSEHTVKLGRVKVNHLRRIESALERMSPRDAGIMAGLALKFAAKAA